jgi:hypothetical protein
MYGMSWFLDAVTNSGWHAIVSGDYEAVMPVYLKRKWIFPYITQPFLCQHCGPYSTKPVNIRWFIEALPAFLLKSVFNLAISESQTIQGYKLSKRTNQYLNLHQPYEVLYQAYNRSTKRNIGRSGRSETEITESGELDRVYHFLWQNDDTGILKKHKQTLHALMKAASENAEVIFQSASVDGAMAGAGFWILFQNRIYWPASAVNAVGREHRIMFAMVDQVIRKYAGQNRILDFCGSSIPNVAMRNAGFGASENLYSYLNKIGTIF